jgi:hypothetical protein
MKKIYVIIIQEKNELIVKGYNSFSRLCTENGISKKDVNKTMVPLKIGNITIMQVQIDTRI